jgi:uncharacterized protein YciI
MPISSMGSLSEASSSSAGRSAATGADDVALLAVEAADEEELRSNFGEDPWAMSGVLRVKEVRAWTLWLDGR